MKTKRYLYGSVLVVLSGCATYKLQPLGKEHPANLQASSAPLPPLSKTLAYSRGDRLAMSAAAATKEEHKGHHPSGETGDQKTVMGEGKVVATVPNANQVVVEHGQITGFMDAMTMGYQVGPSSLLDGLKAGDQIRFTIDVPTKTIVKIEKIK